MCRILALKTTGIDEKTRKRVLLDFVSMCEKSRTIEGDRQENGWGISWLDENSQWQSFHSLQPIWNDQKKLLSLPNSNHFMIHARSASFNDYLNDVSVNQPYTNENISFAFNGVIKGIKLRQKVPGKIGAQKIFNLILQKIKTKKIQDAFEIVYELIVNNSKEIESLNCVISDQEKIYMLSDSNTDHEYFQPYIFEDNNIKMFCSEKIGNYDWRKLSKKKIITI